MPILPLLKLETFNTSVLLTRRSFSEPALEMAESSHIPQSPGEKYLLWDIIDAVQGFEARANYACGGKISINHGERNIGDFGATHRPITCPPITLRWDMGGITKKIQFPPTEATQELYTSALAELVNDCAPASFGRHGKDVYDEGYRKATKRKKLSFPPSSLGIETLLFEEQAL